MSFNNTKINTIVFFILFWVPTINSYEGDKLVQQETWVEQIWQSLSEKERIAQLFMVATYSYPTDHHSSKIEQLIHDYNIGSLIFMQGTPVCQATLTNRYQQAAKTPLLIAMDAEWGLGMRLTHTIDYPKQMTLGALQDNQLIYRMGREIARQLKQLGVHINFAPVIDINTNPTNPIIGYRAFGENKCTVAAKGIAYMQGLQDEGIVAVVKHFPGHGDTMIDSHQALPTLAHTRSRIRKVELFPFQKAIQAGIGGIMVGHLHIPAYTATPDQASTLSPEIVTHLLQEQLGFQGLVFTDALNMKAVCKKDQPGEVALQALKAGNDILVFSENVPAAIAVIQKAIARGELAAATIEAKVKKILRVKYQQQLHQWKPIDTQLLPATLHTPQAYLLQQQLFEKAITVVANNHDLIPIRKLDTRHIASLSITRDMLPNAAFEKESPENTDPVIQDTLQNQHPATVFQHILSKYAPITHYTIHRTTATPATWAQLQDTLRAYQLVIVSIHDITHSPSATYGLQPAEIQCLQALDTQTNVIIVPFGNVYSLSHFTSFHHVIAAYENHPIAAKVVPQIIFGALPAEGSLPVTVSNPWEAEWGIYTEAIERLGYTYPEAVGMHSPVLQNIDTLIEKAMEDNTLPGCQVVVARKGKIIWEKAYGYHTYAKKRPVTTATLYDIASVTKVIGTVQALMYLQSQGQLDVTQKLAHYLPELNGTNKGHLKIQHILTHQAGIAPYVGWHSIQKLLENASTSPSILYNYYQEPYVYNPHWLRERLWESCVASATQKKKWYQKPPIRYSCVGFLLLARLAEKLLQQPLDHFLQQTWYHPLGLTQLTYRPLTRFPQAAIAPTARYDAFRKIPIQGIVHDPIAALQGGTAGNAGLFSNAHNLAVVLQMNLQDGYYGGTRFLRPGVVARFTKKQNRNNWRGLGWDKPIPGKPSAVSQHASLATYGHMGFTGTAVWVDPTYQLIYVFLSNQTYPDQQHRKSTQRIRTDVHDVIYAALTESPIEKKQ